MSAHVLRGGGVCSARTRQVARNSLVVSMVHALPTAAVTAAFVKMDGVAQIVIMQLDAMAILVANTAPALPMAAVTAAVVKMDGVAQIVRLPVP